MSDSTQSKDFDPDLRDIKNAEKVVEKDNVCSVKKQFLDKAPVKVQWSQNLKQREATYYEVAFTNTSLGKHKARFALLDWSDCVVAEQPKGYLFIVDSKLDTFKQLCREENDKYIFTVTRDFLYGQKNNSGSNRFLVFHDPSTRIYQVSRASLYRSCKNPYVCKHTG